MSHDREHRMCVSKRRFESRKAAVFFGDVRLQRAYRCPYCAGWHLTTKRVRGRLNGSSSMAHGAPKGKG